MRVLEALAPLVFIVVLVSGGCTPTIEDGFYRCDDGRCPRDYVCRSNKHCYRREAEGSDFYAACASDDECESGHCLRAPSRLTTGPGICSQECATEDQCPPGSDGSRSICAFGQCFHSCSERADCPEDSRCVDSPGNEPDRICVRVDDPALEGRIGCMNDSPCTPPARCRVGTGGTGICAWPCSPGSDCPGDSECRAWPGTMPMRLCLGVCEGDADCVAPAHCLGDTMPSLPYCVGQAWTSLPAN